MINQLVPRIQHFLRRSQRRIEGHVELGRRSPLSLSCEDLKGELKAGKRRLIGLRGFRSKEDLKGELKGLPPWVGFHRAKSTRKISKEN